jgi:hypothetical protein
VSRHIVQNKNLECVFGWDGPLSTYFGQVLDSDRPIDQSEVVFWCGATRPEEIQSPEALAVLMAPYYALDAEDLAQLHADRATAPPPTPLQRQLQDLMRGGGSCRAPVG